MKRGIELLCAWGGAIFAVLFFAGILAIAHFVPPLPPSESAADIAAIYQQHTNAIRTGLLLAYLGCGSSS